MERLFQINQQLDIPIYQQLVDRIRAAVKKGELEPGQKLPTVQELADNLGVAKGTVKRAYDELEHNGLLEKIQGRGTFICYQPSNSTSRKERAMAAIDGLLDELEGMGFSPTEISIFLTLKQRERSEDLSTVNVGVLECSPEILSQISEQLRRVKGIEVYSYLLEGIQEYPYKLDEQTDLVITTAEHAEYLESVLSDRKKIARVALRVSAQTLGAMMRLRAGERVGILTSSSSFADLVYQSCRSCTRNVAFAQPRTFDAIMDMDAFLADKDAVLVPKAYERCCSVQHGEQLRSFERRGKLILCAYEMDDGSLLSLEEKLCQLRQDKTI